MMPVKVPPLESVMLKGLNFESGCVMAEAIAKNVTDAEWNSLQCLRSGSLGYDQALFQCLTFCEGCDPQFR